MKKWVVLSAFSILSGCAMGINHNVATIKGKPYLIETKTYGFLIGEWSSPSTLTLLEEPQTQPLPTNYNSSSARAELAKIADQCNIQSIKVQARPNYKKMYKCIVEQLTKLEQNVQ